MCESNITQAVKQLISTQSEIQRARLEKELQSETEQEHKTLAIAQQNVSRQAQNASAENYRFSDSGDDILIILEGNTDTADNPANSVDSTLNKNLFHYFLCDICKLSLKAMPASYGMGKYVEEENIPKEQYFIVDWM